MSRRLYFFIISIVETILNFGIISGRIKELLFCRKKWKFKEDTIFHIIGNGPSLKEDLNVFLNTRDEKEKVMCVNAFVNTSEFNLVNPDYYILSDKAFFESSNLARIKKLKEDIIKNFKTKLDRNICLYVPYKYRNSKFTKKLKANPRVEIRFFTNIPILGGFKEFNILIFKMGIANPPFNNILVAAIFQTLKMGAIKIKLWGADHSWVEGYCVANDNVLYTKDMHFNDSNEKKQFINRNRYGHNAKVHEEFESLAKTFKAYHDLNSYANKIKCEIINCSSKSWIDAFDRLKS